ncbi:MAG TPA: RIP metalloprotease RseP [Gemmatimonadales bacterium]
MLLTIGAFALVLGVLIFVHEAGHFIAAKAVGIQVLRFSLGFGKPIFSVQRGETEYCISALPLGGYVKMAGLEDEGMAGEIEGGTSPVPVDPARAFDKKGLPARMVVIVAGVTMNFLLAVGIFSVLAGTIGERRLDTTQIDTVRTAGLPPEIAGALSTIHRGDRVTAVNGVSVRYWDDVGQAILRASFPVRLELGGGRSPVVLAPQRPSDSLRLAILSSIDPLIAPVIDVVEPGTPADHAGLASGDRVLRVNGDSMASWAQFTRVVRDHPHDSLRLDLARGGVTRAVRVVPVLHQVQAPGSDTMSMAGYLGIAPVLPEAHQQFGAVAAVGEGWRQSIDVARQIFAFVGHLASGQGSVRELGGPIAIASISGKAARAGAGTLAVFIARLSVELAILNLLPIPILDGGQLVFLVAEGIRRRPLSLDLRLRLTQVGFVFIILLMTFVIGNDVLRYVFHR